MKQGDCIIIEDPTCSHHHEFHLVEKVTNAQVAFRAGNKEKRKGKNKIIKVKKHILHLTPVTQVIPQQTICRAVTTLTQHFIPSEVCSPDSTETPIGPSNNVHYSTEFARPFRNLYKHA